MAIRVRRGLDVDRLTVILEEGEIAFTTDTQMFYVGDNVTLGGIFIGPGAAAPTAWGTITGLLVNQLDLQAALNTKEPTIAAGLITDYWRGDKSWQPFPSIPVVTPAALTRVDDTNVTLTLGGTPGTALLQATSLTLGWAGTLADARIASSATWNAKQDAITLTTLGTSGAATFIANTLNIPNYADQFVGTVTSVAATVPTFLSVSGSPITTSGTLAVTLSGTALPVLNGGTGVTTSTGSGNTVLSTSPTLVTPILGSASATALTFTSTAVSGSTINKLTTAQRQALTPVMGDVVYDTTIGTTCTYNGTFWEYIKEYYVTANVSTTAITASTITGLTTFILEANSTYSISGQFLITCSSTGGVKFGNSLPSGAVSYINYAGASTSTTVYLQQPSNIGALTPTAHNRNAASSYLTFGGVINIGATSGAVSMQFASGVAAQTSIIYGNFPSGFQSKITLTKIA